MTKYFRQVILINFFSLIIFISDRLIRWYFFSGKKSFFIIDDFFVLELRKNTGIAFSIQLNQWLLLILIILILIFLVNLLIRSYQQKSIFAIISLTWIIIGAICNLIDRIKFGFIVDYIRFWILPIFNLADLMILGGVSLLLWKNFFKNKKCESL